MKLKRTKLFFINTPDGPRKVSAEIANQRQRAAGSMALVALIVEGRRIMVKDLPFKTVREAIEAVGPGGKIGIPITRHGKLGIVFQAATVAKSGSFVDNQGQPEGA